jgi:hypothetical protein
MRQMKVDKLGIDLLTHDPVVILKDLEGKRFLPILIGPFEATAIALALEGTAVPRPLSHDLMRTMLESLHASLEQIVIHDIKDSTFFAKLIVRQNHPTASRSRCACKRRSSFPTRSCSKKRSPTRRRKPKSRNASRSSSKNFARAISKNNSTARNQVEGVYG